MDKIDAFVSDVSNEVVAVAKTKLKNFKLTGIILSVVLISFGIVLFTTPVRGTAIAMWMMVVGLLIRSIVDVILYSNMPKALRNDFDLVMGILWIIICIFSLVGAANSAAVSKLVAVEVFYQFIAVMVAFSCFTSGISLLCSIKRAKSLGMSTIGIILSGVLNIIAGICVITYPIGSVMIMTSMFGFFLLLGGISLLCRFLSIKAV